MSTWIEPGPVVKKDLREKLKEPHFLLVPHLDAVPLTELILKMSRMMPVMRTYFLLGFLPFSMGMYSGGHYKEGYNFCGNEV